MDFQPGFGDIAHLGHVELLTPKFDESVEFFTKIVGLHMAGHVNLGNDRYEMRLGEGDDLANVILRIESAVARIALRSPRADFSELRIFLDLDSPALIVGEMPVESIQLQL